MTTLAGSTPEDDLAARSRVLAILTGVLGITLGWAAGRVLLILGWLAGRTWLIVTFFADAVACGFRDGAKLPRVPKEPPGKK